MEDYNKCQQSQPLPNQIQPQSQQQQQLSLINCNRCHLLKQKQKQYQQMQYIDKNISNIHMRQKNMEKQKQKQKQRQKQGKCVLQNQGKKSMQRFNQGLSQGIKYTNQNYWQINSESVIRKFHRRNKENQKNHIQMKRQLEDQVRKATFKLKVKRFEKNVNLTKYLEKQRKKYKTIKQWNISDLQTKNNHILQSTSNSTLSYLSTSLKQSQKQTQADTFTQTFQKYKTQDFTAQQFSTKQKIQNFKSFNEFIAKKRSQNQFIKSKMKIFSNSITDRAKVNIQRQINAQLGRLQQRNTVNNFKNSSKYTLNQCKNQINNSQKYNTLLTSKHELAPLSLLKNVKNLNSLRKTSSKFQIPSLKIKNNQKSSKQFIQRQHKLSNSTEQFSHQKRQKIASQNWKLQKQNENKIKQYTVSHMILDQLLSIMIENPKYISLKYQFADIYQKMKDQMLQNIINNQKIVNVLQNLQQNMKKVQIQHKQLFKFNNQKMKIIQMNRKPFYLLKQQKKDQLVEQINSILQTLKNNIEQAFKNFGKPEQAFHLQQHWQHREMNILTQKPRVLNKTQSCLRSTTIQRFRQTKQII